MKRKIDEPMTSKNKFIKIPIYGNIKRAYDRNIKRKLVNNNITTNNFNLKLNDIIENAINLDIIEDNINLPWNWNDISKRYDILTLDFIEKHIDNLNHNILSGCKLITYNFVKKYCCFDWNYLIILHRFSSEIEPWFLCFHIPIIFRDEKYYDIDSEYRCHCLSSNNCYKCSGSVFYDRDEIDEEFKLTQYKKDNSYDELFNKKNTHQEYILGKFDENIDKFIFNAIHIYHNDIKEYRQALSIFIASDKDIISIKEIKEYEQILSNVKNGQSEKTQLDNIVNCNCVSTININEEMDEYNILKHIGNNRDEYDDINIRSYSIKDYINYYYFTRRDNIDNIKVIMEYYDLFDKCSIIKTMIEHHNCNNECFNCVDLTFDNTFKIKGKIEYDDYFKLLNLLLEDYENMKDRNVSSEILSSIGTNINYLCLNKCYVVEMNDLIIKYNLRWDLFVKIDGKFSSTYTPLDIIEDYFDNNKYEYQRLILWTVVENRQDLTDKFILKYSCKSIKLSKLAKELIASKCEEDINHEHEYIHLLVERKLIIEEEKRQLYKTICNYCKSKDINSDELINGKYKNYILNKSRDFNGKCFTYENYEQLSENPYLVLNNELIDKLEDYLNFKKLSENPSLKSWMIRRKYYLNWNYELLFKRKLIDAKGILAMHIKLLNDDYDGNYINITRNYNIDMFMKKCKAIVICEAKIKNSRKIIAGKKINRWLNQLVSNPKNRISQKIFHKEMDKLFH